MPVLDCGYIVRRLCTGRYLPAHLRRIPLMGQRVVSPILRRTTITATTSCRTEFFDMARAQRVRHIPADSHENNLWGKWAPLNLIAIVAVLLIHGCSERRMIPQSASKKNCDKTLPLALLSVIPLLLLCAPPFVGSTVRGSVSEPPKAR